MIGLIKYDENEQSKLKYEAGDNFRGKLQNMKPQISGFPQQELISDSTLTILGTGFTINGSPVSYGEYTIADYSSGHITGTLISGEVISNDFFIYDNSSIILAVPEPCTLIMLGFGGLILRKGRNS